MLIIAIASIVPANTNPIIIFSTPSAKMFKLNKEKTERKALIEISNKGQAYANAHFECYPWYTFTTCCLWGSAYSSFALTGTGSVNFSLVLNLNGTTVHGKFATLAGPLYIPSSTQYISISSAGNTYTLVFLPSGEIDISGPNLTTTLQLSGTYTL